MRHGAVGVFLGDGHKRLGRGWKREGVQHCKRKVEFVLDGCVAGNREMHLAKVLMDVRLRVGVRGRHRTGQAKHEGTAAQLRDGFEYPSKPTHHWNSLLLVHCWFFLTGLYARTLLRAVCSKAVRRRSFMCLMNLLSQNSYEYCIRRQ